MRTMAKLKLGVLDGDKPIKVTHELPASVHRDLVAYAEILARESSQPISDPVKLICTNVGAVHGNRPWFAKARHAREHSKTMDG